MTYRTALVPAIVLAVAASAASAQVVFQNHRDNGWFLPFNASTPSNVRFGDGGWLGNTGSNFTLNQVRLGLAANGPTAGTADLTFTFNEGDPSGLIFGSGAPLFSTTLHNVPLPANDGEGNPSDFFLSIPLPNLQTLGGFNNIGFSLSVSNVNYSGSFGFQCASAFAQSVGFYTDNASQFDGSNWSLFSFGMGPYGVANFVTEINQVPAPASLTLLAGAGLFASRRRRAPKAL